MKSIEAKNMFSKDRIDLSHFSRIFTYYLQLKNKQRPTNFIFLRWLTILLDLYSHHK